MAASEPKSNSINRGNGLKETKGHEKSERKLTVLETHGYTLGKCIGAGSYATVKAPGDYLKKFLPREIEVVKGLKHPNLIRFLQAIETTHRVYIVMEFAANGSLLDMIRRDSFIDEERSRRWFRQLIDGVEYCHDRGVVHRDIKCENLLMDSVFNIKLSDFGFARGHMKPKNGVAPLSDTFCGSYAYASPEILRGIPYQPQLSDVWSMGVVLYAMVYGQLPFDDKNYAQLLKQVQNKVTFPKDPKISTSCQSLITRVLSPQRQRPRITSIRNDSWLTAPVTVAPTSVTDTLVNYCLALNMTLLTKKNEFNIARTEDSSDNFSLQDARMSSDTETVTVVGKISRKEISASDRNTSVSGTDAEMPITNIESPLPPMLGIAMTEERQRSTKHHQDIEIPKN